METGGVAANDRWQRLAPGCFTGIEWSKPGALVGIDPYLVWAETTSLARRAGEARDDLMVMLELADGVSVAELIKRAKKGLLQVPPIYHDRELGARLRHCSARVTPAFFRAMAPGGPLQGSVTRVQIERSSTSAARTAFSAPGAWPSRSRARLTGKVLGVIDDGLAVAHNDFRDARGRTRVASLWCQDGQGSPGPMGYGREVVAAEIDQAMAACVSGGMVDESQVYSRLGLSALGRRWPGGVTPFHGLDLADHHGTAVAALAAGPRTLRSRSDRANGDPPTWDRATDAGANASIVAVQLPHATVADTSGGTLSAHVWDGLVYILSRCGPEAQIAVNISFGVHAGPHNGLSVLERAMDQLCLLYQDRLRIVLAAGNSYQSRTHANMTLASGQSETLNWIVHPDDHTESYLEVWLESGQSSVEVVLTPPGGDSSPALTPDGGCVWIDSAGRTLCAVLYVDAANGPGSGACILVALAPTASLEDPSAALAPSGTWKLKLTQKGSDQVTLDAYVQRDDVIAGTHTGGRQSCFEDARYDPESLEDRTDNPSLIRRCGNFNSIATGKQTISVAGTRIGEADQRWARYSPRPDAACEARPRREGVTVTPTTSAPSDNSAALEGVLCPGTRSGGFTRLRGTSAAAPQVTRAVLDAM